MRSLHPGRAPDGPLPARGSRQSATRVSSCLRMEVQEIEQLQTRPALGRRSSERALGIDRIAVDGAPVIAWRSRSRCAS